MRCLLLLARLLPLPALAYEPSLGATTVSTGSFFRSTQRRWGLEASHAREAGP